MNINMIACTSFSSRPIGCLNHLNKTVISTYCVSERHTECSHAMDYSSTTRAPEEVHYVVNMASACYVIALLWLLAGLTRIWLCSMLNSLSYYDFYYFEVILFYMKESLYCL